jgi:amino acid adenylation domain-containing protein
MTDFNLALDFVATVRHYPNRLALSVDGIDYSYQELGDKVARTAAWLHSQEIATGSRVGILACRSIETYIGVLAACWVGATYVPVNATIPPQALVGILEAARLHALIVDKQGLAALTNSVMDVCPQKVLAPAPSVVGNPPARPSLDWIRDWEDLQSLEPLAGPCAMAPDSTAYIEPTSGSTGAPKLVMIPASAVVHFLSMMQERYRINSDDRVAATSDITFDIAVFNMFLAWKAGASLHVVPRTQIVAPAKFIREKEISIWFSVPSIAAFMGRMRMLAPGSFPHLRHSMFAGESLSLDSAVRWQAAAPNSTVENLYGPTEATVVCTVERIGEHPGVTPGRGVIPIGRPLPGTGVAVLGPDYSFLSVGEPGQIALSGPQLAQGYFGQPELTKERFPTIQGTRWYLTGDLGYQDALGVFHHLGRVDNQVKVLGNRVELEEIESHLRLICGSEMVAVVPWPVDHGSAQGLVAFVSGTDCATSDVIAAMRSRVPNYMVPGAIRVLEALPLNANGKVDRRELERMLAAQS